MSTSSANAAHQPAARCSATTARTVARARVLDCREVAPSHFQLRFHAPAVAQFARPGQFVHVLTVPPQSVGVFDPLLRRALSIMSVQSGQSETFDLLFRVEGRGTAAFARARIGDEIDLIGPLGRPFDLSPFEMASVDGAPPVGGAPREPGMFHVKHSLPSAILVGGGVGVPPLVFLGQHLREREVAVRVLVGARAATEVLGTREFAHAGVAVEVATEDGSRGHQGRVTELLVQSLEAAQSRAASVLPVVYACGPWPMLRAVAQICEDKGVRCQVSLEEAMPCGIGVCNGCVVRARAPHVVAEERGLPGRDTEGNRGEDWSPYRIYRRICVEGPACWADEIDWDDRAADAA